MSDTIDIVVSTAHKNGRYGLGSSRVGCKRDINMSMADHSGTPIMSEVGGWFCDTANKTSDMMSNFYGSEVFTEGCSSLFSVIAVEVDHV